MPRPWLPFAEGKFLTPSGKCEFYSERLAAMGIDPLPTFTPPHEFPEKVPELAAKYPLQLISSPRHEFLNTTFVNVDALRKQAVPAGIFRWAASPRVALTAWMISSAPLIVSRHFSVQQW